MTATAADNLKGFDKIKKIVVLMFENRSFDHIFGDYPGANGLMRDGKINPDYYNLQDPMSPPSDTENPKIFPLAVDPNQPLLRDYNHDFGDGMMVSLFGPVFNGGSTTPLPHPTPGRDVTYYSGFVNGKPMTQNASGTWQETSGQTYPANNSGFYVTYQDNTPQEDAALLYFKHGDLKVFPEIAKNFVLCDNWHCDMPGHTMPNRLFIHCGQTANSGIDDTDGIVCNAPTVFDRINTVAPNDWKMYSQVTEISGHQTLARTDIWFLNQGLQKNFKAAPITEFKADCDNGTLPFYSFVMCWLNGNTPHTDTSMHPQSMIQGGENLIAAVYNTLRNSKSWDETLLVITFDENGGLYDHVMPPSATPPDPKKPFVSEVDGGDCGNAWQLNSRFDFSLLGPRVPAILVSPWLRAGIDSDLYQNTSVTRFLIDKLNLEFQKDVPPLSKRDGTAPSLASAFLKFGVDAIREDCPKWIEPYAKLPTTDPKTGSDKIIYSDGKLSVWVPPSGTDSASPAPYTRELLNMYVSSMPGHCDSGKSITQTFDTNAELEDYVQVRIDAAEKFLASAP